MRRNQMKQVSKMIKEVNSTIQTKFFYMINIENKNNNKKFKFLAVSTTKSKLRNYLGMFMEKMNFANNLDKIGAVVYGITDNSIKVSLRKKRVNNDSLNNLKEEEYNLAEICSIFNGGGHESAASFIVERSTFNSISSFITNTSQLKIPKFDIN